MKHLLSLFVALFLFTFLLVPTSFTQALNETPYPALLLERDTYPTQATINAYIVNAKPDTTYTIWWEDDRTPLASEKPPRFVNIFGYSDVGVFQINTNAVKQKRLCMVVSPTVGNSLIGLECKYATQKKIFITGQPIPTLSVSPTPIKSNNPGVAPGNPNAPTPSAPAPSPPCSKIGEAGKCLEVQTGFGIAFSTTPEGFIKSLFSLILGLAGGVALILIIYAGYKLMRSQGDPEAVKAAKELITSAVIGLLFIIFSLVILQTLSVNILKIPGFSNTP